MRGDTGRRFRTKPSVVWGFALVVLGCEQAADTAQDTTQPPSTPLGAAGGAAAANPDAATPAASQEASASGGRSSVTGAPDAAVAAADGALPSTSSDAHAVTYQKDIRALMETNCLDCHTQGGIGPIAFDDWKTVQSVASLVVDAVTSGIMPPSGWNEECQKLNETRSLSPEQRALFQQWKQAGLLEGNASDYVAPPARIKKQLGAPSILMSMGVAYTPPANADEYRCFLLDAIPNETYLTGMQILPGQADEVHHVIIHRVENAQLAQVHTLEQADAKPGYVCNGGAGVSAQNMFSYRPGSEAVTFAQGDAAYIAPGSSLVIQVHYNTVFLGNGKQPTPDETKVALWTLPAGQLPERVVYRTTTFGPINIPANNPHIVSNISQSMRTLSSLGGTLGVGGTFVAGEVIGMTPHAHQLATSMNASLKRADGGGVCLDDVKWDFHWQLDYMFGAGVPYEPTDTFTASCTYDNSVENQPVINGVKQAPKNVAFGERSTDEMCEHYIWLRFARDAFLSARK